MYHLAVYLVGLCLLGLLAAGCGPAPAPTLPSTLTAGPTAPDSYPGPGTPVVGYPAPTNLTPGYPAAAPNLPDNLSTTPPNPERDLPAAAGEAAVMGGVLVQEIVGAGFVPLEPVALILAKVLYTDAGEPAFLASGDDQPRAQLFPTGIFIFQDIPPGTYGLVVDVGYAEFPIQDESGEIRLITLEAGQTLDLGQLITTLP